MHLDRRLLGWGIFLVLLGAVPLAVRQGALPAETVARAWTLWPLLLVAAGIGILLRRTPLEVVGTLLSAATLGLIGGGLLAGGFPLFGSCGGGDDSRDSVPFATQQGQLGPTATVDLTLNCGGLTVQTAEGSAWSVEGVGDRDGPRIDASQTALRVASRSRDALSFIGSTNRWVVRLPTASRLDVHAQVNAGTGRFDLASAQLGRVEIGANAGDVTIDLSRVASIGDLDVTMNAVGNSRILLPNLDLRGSVDANATGSIRLCPPSGAGLRLTPNDNPTSSNNYAERGLVRKGDAWETPNFATADVQIELETSVNAGSFNLEQEGTCSG